MPRACGAWLPTRAARKRVAPFLAAAQAVAAKVDPGCPGTLREFAGPFMLRPDARQGGVVVQPSRLAHASAACGVPLTIGVAALRRLGASPALLDAVTAAHRAGQPADKGPGR